MAGFLSNLLPFGSSNQNNPNTPPPAAGSAQQGAYQTGTQQIAQPANNNAQPTPPGTDGAPNPANSADPSKGQVEVPALDQYKDLFTMPASGTEPKNPMAEPLLQYDPAKLQAAAKQANFAANIDPELATKALSGDVASFMQVVNQTAQNAFLAATASTANVVEQAVRKNNDRYDSVLPDRVRNVQINQAQMKNPALSHPAAAPLVAAMKAQIAAKNPGLSPDKVAEVAEGYFTHLANDLAGGTPAQVQSRNGPQEPDYSLFLQ